MAGFRIKLALLIVVACSAYAFTIACSGSSDVGNRSNSDPSALSELPAVEPTPDTAPDPALASATADGPTFRHDNSYHSNLPCLLCHTRNDNSPRIAFPGGSGHLPCAGCHVIQFSDNKSQMCTICHTDPEAGSMKRFPAIKSFGARFNHSRHRKVNCSMCHKPSRGGVALSIPAGNNAHSTCFQCHTSDAASGMSSCNVCHQPGKVVRRSESARAFRMSFSHAKHTGRRAGLSCSQCHSIQAGSARGRQVSSPQAAMHFAPSRGVSCGGCHNGARAFGADDPANCKRCHTGNSFKF